MVCVCPSPTERFQVSMLVSHLLTLPALLVPTNVGPMSSPFVLFFNFSITDVLEVMFCYHFGLHFLLFMFLFSPPAYEIFFCLCSVVFLLLLFYCRRSLYSLYSLLLSGVAVGKDFPKPGMVPLLPPTGTRSGASHMPGSALLFGSFSTSPAPLFSL